MKWSGARARTTTEPSPIGKVFECASWPRMCTPNVRVLFRRGVAEKYCLAGRPQGASSWPCWLACPSGAPHLSGLELACPASSRAPEWRLAGLRGDARPASAASGAVRLVGARPELVIDSICAFCWNGHCLQRAGAVQTVCGAGGVQCRQSALRTVCSAHCMHHIQSAVQPRQCASKPKGAHLARSPS